MFWLFKYINFKLTELLDWLVDGFSRRICFACRAINAADNKFFCANCFPNIIVEKQNLRKLINLAIQDIDQYLDAEHLIYPKIHYCFEYNDSSRRLVRDFKYRKPHFHSFIANLAFNYWQRYVDNILSDTELGSFPVLQKAFKPLKIFISYIPMHRQKLCKRVYNPAKLLAKSFYQLLQERLQMQTLDWIYQASSGLQYHQVEEIIFLEDLFLREKNTSALYDKNKDERLAVLYGAFVINPDFDFSCFDTNSENLLIVVDDIVTTGITFLEAFRNVNKSQYISDVVFLAASGRDFSKH